MSVCVCFHARVPVCVQQEGVLERIHSPWGTEHKNEGRLLSFYAIGREGRGEAPRQNHLLKHWRVTLCWANQRFPDFLRYGI